MSAAVEIKAGPELNRAVVEAVAVPDAVQPALTVLNFSPSTDLNAAFAAAEAAASGARGFGDWELSTYVGYNEKGWTCQIGDCTERAFAPTPALAICAAILKLKGASDVQCDIKRSGCPSDP